MKYQDYETIAMLVFSLAFFVMEKLSPKNKSLEVKSHLKVDFAAFILIILAVNISRIIVAQFYETIHFKDLGIMAITKTWPYMIKFILAYLVSDFLLYWLHRGMHNSEFLWKTHQFHHSADALYWFSGFRTSFMHALFYASLKSWLAFIFLTSQRGS